MKAVIGLALAFALGFACRAFGIPSPAPPVIMGALFVVAMTAGYILVDRIMTRPARHAVDCGGPSGATAAEIIGTLHINVERREPLRLQTRLFPFLGRLLKSPAIRFIALVGLCAAYLQGGLEKAADFDAAIREAQHFGFPFAAWVAAATTVTELAGSALIITGYYRWLGALWLAAFTLAATFVANRFWELEPAARFMVENSFFEHLGLVGGFLLVAWLDLREKSSATANASRR